MNKLVVRGLFFFNLRKRERDRTDPENFMKILAISDVHKGSQVVSELIKTTGRSLPAFAKSHGF